LASNIELLHRNDRSGYKAGALEAGLNQQQANLWLCLTLIFCPKRDWLKRVVPFFQDGKVAFVQTRWGHINNRYNLITHLLGMALDAHFVIEQTARAGSGLLMSFNGTAGMWRIKAIEEAGGWQGDTLTEDIDLSFRTEFAGWKYIYAPDIVVMSELPAQMDAFKKQQVRWVKGNMQVSRKLMGKTAARQNPLLDQSDGRDPSADAIHALPRHGNDHAADVPDLAAGTQILNFVWLDDARFFWPDRSL
jgi:cellulose synthase/poly-beta-1,6-N-acetylglucosamine synthase-like glycosyltransferase